MEWSDMLPEVVDIIARKHITFYEDYHPFARVCKSWHSAALHNASKFHHYANGPPSRLPSLMLSEKSKLDDNDKHEFRELFLLSNKSIRKIRLPQLHGKLCMSSSGWLVTVGEDHVAQLINPLSHETINLPKVDTFPQFVEKSQWHQGITKLLLLNYNNKPLVVVLWGCSSKLGICRPAGDNKWIHVRKGWGSSIFDVTYYNSRVYTFDGTCHIKACDVFGEDHPMVLVNVTRLPVHLYDPEQEDLAIAYIIGLDDGERKTLLVVIRHGLCDEIEDELWEETYKTKRFLVFRYGLEDGKWSRVKDLGKKTLFVGHNSSFWIEDTTGVIKSNSIYYTDDVNFLYRESKKGGGRDMGIYSLSDKTIEPHFTGESRSCLTPPTWIQI